MGNYSNETLKTTVTIDRNKPAKKIAKLISSLDNDFEEIADKLAAKIVQKHKTVEKMIDAIIGMCSPSDIDKEFEGDGDMSTFILNNEGYCQGFKHDITKIGKDKVKIVFVLSL